MSPDALRDLQSRALFDLHNFKNIFQVNMDCKIVEKFKFSDPEEGTPLKKSDLQRRKLMNQDPSKITPKQLQDEIQLNHNVGGDYDIKRYQSILEERLQNIE